MKRAAIEKTIGRAKKALASSSGLFDLMEPDLPERLASVHRVLYLLFSEGYHSVSASGVVREDLCREAMRLGALLLENTSVATPATYALCALMWLNAARLSGRVNGQGELLSHGDQDRSRWNRSLIEQGNAFLDRSASGSLVSEYHVEAGIAAVHANSARAEDVDWSLIVSLYDTLMQIRPSPVVALNRAIAIGQMSGPESGLAAVRAIAQIERLSSYPFLPAALGDLEIRAGNIESARAHFEAAVALARSPKERRFLASRLKDCLDREAQAR